MTDTALTAKEKILEAARKITQEQGADHLTISAVAKEAGLSKGGVLYHFQKKEELLEALVDSYAKHLAGKLEEGKKKCSKDKDPLVPGFISWFETFQKNDGGSRAWGSSLFAVHSHDPQLLTPVRDWYQELFDEIRSSSYGFEKAASIILALEGLFYLNLFDMDLMTEAEHKKVLTYLKKELKKKKN